MAKVTPRQEVKLLQTRLARLNALLISAMDETLAITKQRVITKHLSAKRKKARNSVRRQSGRLQKSIFTTKATRGAGFTAVASFRITSEYAGVHIGKRGNVTRISGKGGNLAIPTKFARKANGEPLGIGPRDPRFSLTHTAVTRNGNKVMFGRVGGSQKTVPLFTLKRSVVVPTRVDIASDIVKPAQALYTRIVRQGLRVALK